MKLIKKTHHARWSTLAMIMVTAVSTAVQAQSLISSADFFDPDFTARRPGSANFLDLTVNQSFYTPVSQTDGNVTWRHSAGGLVQVGTDLGIASADVQLAAYTQTIGNSLVFGRQLDVTTGGLLSALGGDVTTLTNQALGASAINSWNARSDVANLNLSQGVLYSATFTVDLADGLNIAALSSANFTLLNGGVAISNVNSAQTLDLLGLLAIGTAPVNFNFDFYAPAGLGDLSFNFAASTVANVSLLGPITDNQTVLTISNFNLAPVPEPGSMLLASVGFITILRRRRI